MNDPYVLLYHPCCNRKYGPLSHDLSYQLAGTWKAKITDPRSTNLLDLLAKASGLPRVYIDSKGHLILEMDYIERSTPCLTLPAIDAPVINYPIKTSRSMGDFGPILPLTKTVVFTAYINGPLVVEQYATDC